MPPFWMFVPADDRVDPLLFVSLVREGASARTKKSTPSVGQRPAFSSRSVLERLFAVDRAEHSIATRLMLGVPLPLLLFELGPLLGAPGSALTWFVASTAIFLSGWLGGFASGAMATALSAAIVHHWLLPAHDDRGWFGSDEMVQFVAFVAAGLLVSLLHGQLRASVRKLDRRRREAHEQTRQLEVARDAADIGFWRWDLATQRVEWDRRVLAWLELTHVPPCELRYEHWLSRVHPDDAPFVVESIRRAREDGKPRVGTYRIVLPGGGERYIKSSAVLERDAAGREVAMIGIHHDVTTDVVTARQLAAREREVQALNRQLEERVAERTSALLDALLHAEAGTRAKAAFLRNISHELRTPLNPILGWSRLLAQSIDDPEHRRHLGHIEAAGRQLLSLVNDLIELTSTANDDPAHATIDLAATVDAALLTVAGPAAQRGLHVTSHMDPAIPQIMVGDAARVTQVLVQLLGNAVKFSESGHIQVRCSAGCSGPGFVRVRFEVEDQGIGIAPEMQPHVFDAFRQVREGSFARADGLGIGLALARRAVERLGGEIGVRSAPGTGSTFWFTARFLLEPQVADPAAEERL